MNADELEMSQTDDQKGKMRIYPVFNNGESPYCSMSKFIENNVDWIFGHICVNDERVRFVEYHTLLCSMCGRSDRSVNVVIHKDDVIKMERIVNRKFEQSEKGILFVIYCATGCTCCNDENHYRGPYKTREDAQRRIDFFLSPKSDFWPLASQYAKRGRYNIEERNYELLPDGRLIIEEHYVFSDGIKMFVEVDKDGKIKDNNSEWLADDYCI